MLLRSSVRMTLLTVVLATIASLAPDGVRAQGWSFSVAGGTASPVRPTNALVSLGGQLALAASHRAPGSPLSLGAEAGVAKFGETQLTYALTLPPCAYPGCTFVNTSPTAGTLTLANYLATAKYDLWTGSTHPYVAVAVGGAQRLSSGMWEGAHYGNTFSAAGRAGAGFESRVGAVDVGIDVSYAAVGFSYEGHAVRYVPVTLRLSF